VRGAKAARHTTPVAVNIKAGLTSTLTVRSTSRLGTSPRGALAAGIVMPAAADRIGCSALIGLAVDAMPAAADVAVAAVGIAAADAASPTSG